MDQSEEAKATSLILARTLEGVCSRLQTEKGLTQEQLGLACLVTGLNFLSRAWTGEQLVAHLAGVTAALVDVHGLDPETGERTPRGRPN